MGRSSSTNNKRKTTGKGKHAAPAKGASRSLRANEGRQSLPPRDLEPLMDNGAHREIAAVALAVVSVISFISVVSNSREPVSGAIAGFFHLGFGMGAYVIPLAMLMFAASLFLRDRSPLNPRTLSGGTLILISVLGILSLMVPYTDLGTAGMFEADALVTSGGYLGAFLASMLQKALGKTISYVVLVGVIIIGFVVIGFSVSDFFQAARDRAHALVERRHVNVNEMPWGDRTGAFGGAAAASTQDPVVQGSLFDDAQVAHSPHSDTLKTRVLEEEEVDEDPFVDVSSQLAAERAETTLIPVRDRYVEPGVESVSSRVEADLASVREPVAASATHALEQTAQAEAAGDAVLETTPVQQVATVDGMRPIPDFLKALKPQMKADGTEEGVESARETDKVEKTPPEGPVRPISPAVKRTGSDADDQTEPQLPPMTMLRHNPKSASSASSEKELEQTAHSLQSTLQEFGLHARVVGWISGPTVTTFKVQPGEGERVSRISNLEDDIALSLAAQSVRIFAPIPGTSLVGIEIPNAKRQNVNLGDVLPYAQGEPLELAIGRDAEGAPVIADLAKMPHLLIAGTTGSGKSVMINSIVMALLMRTHPEDVRLIMVDPKRVELSGYNGLPHLYVPVVTEPKQAASALQWGVSEMERRLKVFERLGVRNIGTFNKKQQAGEFEHYDNPPQKMPYLVIIIDELSDLMMVAGKDVEASIVRIAQLGRAAGIHLIVATQRPSSNVVTGLIKANITNRIAFNVATGIDSRVIIDQMGAEKLTGYGDMLFSKVDWGKPKRIQGCFVSDDEINGVVEFVKEQGAPDYHEEILSVVSPSPVGSGGGGGGFYNEAPSEEDPLLWDAAKIVVESQLGSTSGLQRRLKVGYARAGRIMDMLEEKGIVGPPDGSKPREVLYDEEGLAALRAVEEPLSDDEIFGGM